MAYISCNVVCENLVIHSGNSFFFSYLSSFFFTAIFLINVEMFLWRNSYILGVFNVAIVKIIFGIAL